MIVDRIIQWFLPREVTFFAYLDKIATNLVEGAKVFDTLREAKDAEAVEALASKLKLVEQEGDALAKLMHDALDQTFVTPLDREDLHALTSALEGVLDSLEGTTARYSLYGFEEPGASMKRLIEIIVECTGEMAKGVALLKDLSRSKEIQLHVAHVDRLETEADQVYRTALGALFKDPPETVVMIRRKELLDALERTVDRCSAMMTVLRAVLIKNA